MELYYKGKTKDVFTLPDGNFLLLFKDDVTGEDGVFDPGSNTVGLSIEGIGRRNLRASALFFEALKQRGIATHYISADFEKATMTVRKVDVFGRGLEVICRYRATGSFIRRYGEYMPEWTPLPAYVECTLKDDERGDPLITCEGLEALGIMDRLMFDRLKAATQEIAGIVKDMLAEKGLELCDIKFEFGTVGGEVILIDEIASGNMRVLREGSVVDPIELTNIILGE